MKKVDYILVGLGIAGLCMAERILTAGKSFVVFDRGSGTATKIAGGVINPVVLKRFTPVWQAADFLTEAESFYEELATRLKTSFFRSVSLHRIFSDPRDQNNWIAASDRKDLTAFLSSVVETNENPALVMPFGYGLVKQAFQLSTELLLASFKQELHDTNRLIEELFDYELLNTEEGSFRYKNYRATKIVFTEGTAVRNNPYFTLDCLIPKKGEYITIKAPQLGLKSVLKGPFFIIPLGNDLYKVGATFAHGDHSPEVTNASKQQLIKALNKIVQCPFEVVDSSVGFRPTVVDRRPLLGSIQNKRMLFFNGLGTRGLLMAPLLSDMLFRYSEQDVPIPMVLDVARFSRTSA